MSKRNKEIGRKKNLVRGSVCRKGQTMENGKINRERLAENACEELLSYGIWNGKERLKRGVKKYILHRQIAPQDLIFWPTGLLAAGLWKYRGKAAQTGRTDAALAAYYGRWIGKGMPITCLDDLLAGETLLAAYQEKNLPEEWQERGLTMERIRKALDMLADYAMQYPTDETGSFPYRYRPQSLQKEDIFVDTIGLACPYLYQYGEMSGRQEYQEIAVRQIANYLAYGMDEEHNLPYHGYELKKGCKYGIIGWGRAVGWLLRGMCGCMQTAYGKEKIGEFYRPIVDSVLGYQRNDGYFGWQLEAKDGPKDTSATAMIGVALQEGIRLGVLPQESYIDALLLCTEALAKSEKDGKIYDCSGECEGFAQYPQRYDAYPWALGPALELF